MPQNLLSLQNCLLHLMATPSLQLLQPKAIKSSLCLLTAHSLSINGSCLPYLNMVYVLKGGRGVVKYVFGVFCT